MTENHQAGYLCHEIYFTRSHHKTIRIQLSVIGGEK